MNVRFDRYLGIDWSGAEQIVNAIQVAECCSSGNAELVLPLEVSFRKKWSRTAVFEYVSKLLETGEQVLVGLDFAFSFPYCDMGAYFPSSADSPRNVSALWEVVEDLCRDDPDYYGGAFFKDGDKPFASYFLYEEKHKELCDVRRLRVTERKAKEMSFPPQSVFKCKGIGQAGTGSLAGMRWLCDLKKKCGKAVAIWPFEDIAKPQVKVVITEIYPRIFKMPDRVSKYSKLSKNEHELDALVVADGLSVMASRENMWKFEDHNEKSAKLEGWIFGIES